MWYWLLALKWGRKAKHEAVYEAVYGAVYEAVYENTVYAARSGLRRGPSSEVNMYAG